MVLVNLNSEGRILGEYLGGEPRWFTRKQSDSEIKNFVKKHIQGDLERTAGLRYSVTKDKIYLVDKKTFNKVLRKARLDYTRWLGSHSQE